MRKRRDGLARLGTVFLALLVGLFLTGMGYGIWSDTLNIHTTIKAAEVSFELSATDNYTDPESGSVTCEVVDDALEVTVINADTTYDYYGDFTIENTGDIPLKMRVDTVYAGVVTTIIIDSPGDGIIDPTETESGEVKVDLIDGTQQGETFTVITNVVLWNQ